MAARRGCIATLIGIALVAAGCSAPPRSTVDDPWPTRETARVSRPVTPAAPGAAGAALDWARARIGSPYRWGGTGAEGFDCSGLVQAAYARAGVRLPRTTDDQARRGAMIRRDQIRPGDLVFFGEGSGRIDHVGIAAGGGRFVHASSSRGVVEDSLDSSWFRRRYVFARRLTTSTAGS